jgi:hypothetical protein
MRDIGRIRQAANMLDLADRFPSVYRTDRDRATASLLRAVIAVTEGRRPIYFATDAALAVADAVMVDTDLFPCECGQPDRDGTHGPMACLWSTE